MKIQPANWDIISYKMKSVAAAAAKGNRLATGYILISFGGLPGKTQRCLSREKSLPQSRCLTELIVGLS